MATLKGDYYALNEILSLFEDLYNNNFISIYFYRRFSEDIIKKEFKLSYIKGYMCRSKFRSVYKIYKIMYKTSYMELPLKIGLSGAADKVIQWRFKMGK